MNEKQLKTLYIFDFDGTLFKSPEPNPSVWNSSIMGKIKAPPSEGGLGFYQSTITLDDPYVPIIPDRNTWFNTKVLDHALDVLKDENNVVCLLTGRSILYKDIIDRILKSVGIEFHHKGLKPLIDNHTTFDFKKQFILELVYDTYKDQIDKIFIFEDRIRQVDLFNSFLSTLYSISNYYVYHINEEPKYLEYEQELKVVDYLVSKYTFPKAKLKKLVDYTGLVLDDNSINKVLSLFEIPKDWIPKSHHVTLNLGKINHKIWKPVNPKKNILNSIISTIDDGKETTTIESLVISPPDFHIHFTIGSKWGIKIEAIGFSSNALAIKVSGIPSANYTAHITVAIRPNSKPSDSNQIKHWFPIDKLKQGEKIKLISNGSDRELTPLYYSNNNNNNNHNHNHNHRKQKHKSTTSPPQEQLTCDINLPINNNEKLDLLSLTGTIIECGKLTYEFTKKPKKNRYSNGNRNTTTSNSPPFVW